MIRHIVFFSAKRGVEAITVRDGLMALAAIPASSHFEVSLNSKVDPWSSEIDVVVYAEFPDEAALAAYKAHPVYAETTKRVRPMRELRYSDNAASVLLELRWPDGPHMAPRITLLRRCESSERCPAASGPTR